MVPQHLYEHLLARHYGWSLQEIRSMSNYDFQVHLRICLTREKIDNEFQVALAGGKPGKASKGGRDFIQKKFDPMKGDFV